MKLQSFFRSLSAAIILASPLVQAESVPKLINYQGKLTNAEGQALQNGNYNVRFTLWDAATGGNLVWGENRAITLVSGIFNVALGGAGSTPVAGAAVNDITYAFGSENRFLETTILSSPGVTQEQPLAPRQQMASVPFAMQAQNASLFRGKQPVHYYTPPGAVLAFAGPVVPDGYMACNGDLKNVVDYPELFAAIGYTYGGSGDTFRLPNYQGRFLRGLNGDSGLDPGRVNFSLQGDNLPIHRHVWGSAGAGDRYTRPIRSYNSAGTLIDIITRDFDDNQTNSGGGNRDDYKTVSVSDNTTFVTAPNSTIRDSGEVRPVNASVNFIIKY